MSQVLASYEYHYGNADWFYHLHGDRMAVTGHTGRDQFEQNVDLAYYSPYPNRTTTIHVERKKNWAAWGAILFFVIGFGVWFALLVNDVLPAGADVGLLGGWFGLSFPVYYLIVWRTTRHLPLKNALFRRKDNQENLVIWQIGEETGEAFDLFVAKVQAVIRSLQSPA